MRFCCLWHVMTVFVQKRHRVRFCYWMRMVAVYTRWSRVAPEHLGVRFVCARAWYCKVVAPGGSLRPTVILHECAASMTVASAALADRRGFVPVFVEEWSLSPQSRAAGEVRRVRPLPPFAVSLRPFAIDSHWKCLSLLVGCCGGVLGEQMPGPLRAQPGFSPDSEPLLWQRGAQCSFTVPICGIETHLSVPQSPLQTWSDQPGPGRLLFFWTHDPGHPRGDWCVGVPCCAFGTGWPPACAANRGTPSPPPHGGR